MSKQYLQTHTIPDAHPTSIFSIAVTPTQLLSASGSSRLRVHNTKGQVIHADSAEDEEPYPLAQTLDKAHPLGCHHICTSEDGKVAASAGFGGEVKVWEYAAEDALWKERAVIKPQKASETWALALTSNGDYLASTSHAGHVNIYSITSNPPTQKCHYETKGSFALSVDLSSWGTLTASGHQNGTIHLFNNGTQRLTHSLSGLIKPIRTVKFSPAEIYLAAAGDAKIIALYDVKSGEQVANLTGHASWIMSVEWNWSGEFLLSGGYDGKAKIWSIERRQCVATQTESESCLWCVKWLPKTATMRNETFVTGSAAGTLAFYREASGT